MNEKIYNINKKEAKKLLEYCNNNIDTLAVFLYDKGIVNSLYSGLKRAERIKNFINK